jgi:REP element-mobilizing transposase RayT
MANLHRLKSRQAAGIYHCISRTISGEKLFDDASKEVLRKHLHQVADFCGVQVVTYAMMSNHFHVLVKVPEQGVVSDAELLRRYKVLHPEPSKYATAQIEILEAVLKAGGKDADEFRARLLARMNDVSQFMKTFKQRFSIWFNDHHERFGPLWAERFTSTIIEGGHRFALKMVAAYIDLNPVRAGLAKDPKNYRWCGYGEAVAIGGEMLRGLRLALDTGGAASDAELLDSYRLMLFGKGAEAKHGDPNAARINPENLKNVLKANGKLSATERLRLRACWFTKGAVIGGKKFVKEHLDEYRVRTRKRKHIEPRALAKDAADPWGQLHSMRNAN